MSSGPSEGLTAEALEMRRLAFVLVASLIVVATSIVPADGQPPARGPQAPWSLRNPRGMITPDLYRSYTPAEIAMLPRTAQGTYAIPMDPDLRGHIMARTGIDPAVVDSMGRHVQQGVGTSESSIGTGPVDIRSLFDAAGVNYTNQGLGVPGAAPPATLRQPL